MEDAETIFEQAVELPVQERAAFLDRVCAGGVKLREQVQKLVAAHECAECLEFLSSHVRVCAEKLGDRIDRYKLLEKIGEGGCGVVYVAEQTEPVQRRVALKVIKLGMDTKAVVARFEAERQALAMMDHPNIARVFDAGATATGRPFFVMELVRGIKITEYCDQNHLETKERLDLFMKVCRAIQHAHQKGVIHRDIKPSNILVTLHDGVPVPKVIDFGIAKATEGRLTDGTVYTQLHQFIGTPAYMSPEQAEMSGLDVDTRSDIYSLGVLLYELLTGNTPFDGKKLISSGIDAMRKTIRESEPARPSTQLRQTLIASAMTSRTAEAGESLAHARRQLNATITLLRGDLDWIVMKCLEKDRSRRYDTANGLAADLSRHLNNEPVIARPASAAYKLQKAWRRNKLMFTAAAALAIVLLLGILITSWLLVRADAERRIAEHHLYVANVNRAGQAWEQDNYELVQQLLAETRGFRDRGFEWFYWQRQTHLNLRTLRGHTDKVIAVAFSPNSQRMVTGSDDQSARVWDAASGRELFQLPGHKASVTSVAFSPDGKWIVTGGCDQTARVWEAATGRAACELAGHTAAVNTVAFSQDGQRVVTGSSDRTAKVWDLATRRVVVTLQGHTDDINAAAFSPDDKWIATCSSDRTVRLWNAATGRQRDQFVGHTAAVYAVVFSPDGQRIVSGSVGPIALVWDAAGGQQSPLLKLTGRGPMTSLAFSPDGKRIIAGSWDSTASVWDAASGERLRTIRGHVLGVRSVAISPDGKWIATASGDAQVKIWDAREEQQPLTLHGNPMNMLSAAFSPDGKWIVTGARADDENGQAADSPNWIAQVWNAASGEKLQPLVGHTGGISSVAYSLDGHRILTGSSDHTARIWHAISGQPLFSLQEHTADISAVAISPDGQRVVTGSRDDTARVWEAATGRELFKLTGHKHPVSSVAFSPDGKWILTGSYDQTARLWEAATGRERRCIATPMTRIESVAFSPDSQRIVAGGWPRLAMVWELDGDRGPLSLKGHGSPVRCVAFSPDGKRIVTGSSDGTARVWETATGRELLTLRGHALAVTSVAFSADGQRIVTGSSDGTAKVWDAARADEVAAWQEEQRKTILNTSQ